MATPKADRIRFGALLREARKGRGLSQDRVARQLEAATGERLTGAAVGNWERGSNAPRDRRAVEALGDIVGNKGQLLAALGYAEQPGTFTVAGLHDLTVEEADAARRAVEELRRRRR